MTSVNLGRSTILWGKCKRLPAISVDCDCPTSRSAEQGFLSPRPVYPHTPLPFTHNEIPERRIEVELPRALARGLKSSKPKAGIYPRQYRTKLSNCDLRNGFYFTQKLFIAWDEIWIFYNDSILFWTDALATIMNRLRRSTILLVEKYFRLFF